MITENSYSYDTNVVSQVAFNEHLKLYKAYIGKINEIDNLIKLDPQLDTANSTYSHYRGLKKSETFVIDAIILHEAYFENMGQTKKSPTPNTEKILTNQFGNYQNWHDEFVACATSARGWCVLTYEQRTNTFRNILLDAHDFGDICVGFPILVLDVYEHAYFKDYGTDKATYINKFMDAIDWDVVGRRVSILEP